MNATQDRFWQKTRRLENGCWQWLAGTDQKGYGLISINKRRWRAHRYAYEALVGPIPDGLVLDHLCRNHGCVNPKHLEPVTNRENLHRGVMVKAQKAKTHCPRGHRLEQPNLMAYKLKLGQRVCRACNMARSFLQKNDGDFVEISDMKYAQIMRHA